jgi:predicted DNA-binding transcriptional regulator YafY
MLATALEAIRVYVPSYDRPHGDDLRILQAGFDLGYEVRQRGAERLVDVGLNHPVSEDLALALRMGQEILERAQRAEAEVAALTAQVAALEGELVGLQEAVQDAVSAWDDQEQPADDWSHALDEAVSKLRAIAIDPARGSQSTGSDR